MRLFTIVLSLFCITISGCSGTNGNNAEEQTNNSSSWNIDSNQPIDLMKKYVLENYLKPKFKIFHSTLYFVVKSEYSSPDFEYTAASFLPEKYLEYLNPNSEGFKKENKWYKSNTYKEYGLEDDGESRDSYRVMINYAFGIKDFLDLLEESKNKDYIYFVSFVSDSTIKAVAPAIDDPEERITYEKSFMPKALNIFDEQHNFLNGYYNEFNICLAKEATGKEYKINQILPTFSLNEGVVFNKINDSDSIRRLDNFLPEIADKTTRDWYKVVFPFKMEAQFALQMFKNLTLMSGIFYATTSLCEDENIQIQVPLFRIYEASKLPASDLI